MENNLTCKSINQLTLKDNGKQFCFHIPTYQRGYRWEPEQVTKLLDDFNAFFKAKEQQNTCNTNYIGKFYCLQPIIVMPKHHDDDTIHYEVIDGQQRLITLYILLKTLSHQNGCYQICFDRDDMNKERENYLANICSQTKENSKSKADFHYMYHACKTIEEWKKTYKNNPQNKSLANFLAKILDDVYLIWYELKIDNEPREVFRHINDGKLPLTDGELVKAMLLSSNRFAKDMNITPDLEKYIRIEQVQIARLWDEMERVLQNQKFWTFIYKEPQEMITRLDFIFELVRRTHGDTSGNKKSLTDYFEQKLAMAKDFNDVWSKAREIFRTFQDWYENLNYYHLIGYLVNYEGKTKISDILTLYLSKSKVDFLSDIKKKISSYLNMSGNDIRHLSYDGTSQDKHGRKGILKVLTLFNALETMAIKERFVFQPEKDEWSIEHVFAQNSRLIKEDDKKDWLKRYNEHINATKKVLTEEQRKVIDGGLLSKIEKYIDGNDTDFDALFREILDAVESPGSEIDSIGNFALVSKNANSALSNLPFYEKREKILSMNRDSGSIPVGTVNVFMKAYTKAGASTNLDYWSADDGQRYTERVIDVVKAYLKEEEAGNG